MIVPLVGLGIDATMLRIVQARLSAAVDGAVLGAGRLLGTTADPKLMATEFVQANFQVQSIGFWGATNLQVTPTFIDGITKTITVNATADVPLLFSRIFGQSKATVSAAGTATRTDTRVMLVIDRSGSMARTKLSDGNYPMTDAINDAVEFTQAFTPGMDEVGLVIFDHSAVVAYPSYTPPTYAISTPTATSTGGTPPVPGATGGPDVNFGTTIVNLLHAVTSNNGSTNTSEAIWLAYLELQKAHTRDVAISADTRLNAIVLMTDGLPQAVTIYPNNTTNYATQCLPTPSAACQYFLKAATTCTNKYTSTKPYVPQIFGVISIMASNGSGANTFTGNTSSNNSNGAGVSLPASMDTNAAHTASWSMANPAQTGTLGNGGAGGCATLSANNGPGWLSTTNDLTQIPTKDAYGNAMDGPNYLKTDFFNTNGEVAQASNPIYWGSSPLNMNNVAGGGGQDWAKAMWNAADSAGARVRQDVNRVNRPGDTAALPIYIYTIGFLGDGGCDQGLLASIANDKSLLSTTNFDSTTLAGKYYAASDPESLHKAFLDVAGSILRLAH